MRASAFPILAMLGPSVRADVSPPPPPPPVAAPIEVAVTTPDGRRRTVSVDEGQVRSAKRTNVFYDIDAFIETGFAHLGIEHQTECVREVDIMVCHVVGIDGIANSATHHWQLMRDGRPERHGINWIAWSGVRSLEFHYRPVDPAPAPGEALPTSHSSPSKNP